MPLATTPAEKPLTVRRLIEVLTTMPGDAPVVVSSLYGGVDPVIDVLQVGLREVDAHEALSYGAFRIEPYASSTRGRPAVYVFGGYR